MLFLVLGPVGLEVKSTYLPLHVVCGRVADVVPGIVLLRWYTGNLRREFALTEQHFDDGIGGHACKYSMDINSLCSTLDALSALEYNVMAMLNAKFTALKRMVALIEEAASLNLGAALPNLAGLLPVSAIDLSLYQNLAKSCPFLNLPPAGGTSGLAQLQAQVAAAYKGLSTQLSLNPLNRLNFVQKQIDDLQTTLNAKAVLGGSFMQCLQGICAAGVAATAGFQVMTAAPSKVLATAQAYQQNFVTGAGQVVTGTAQAKMNQLNAAQAQLAVLIKT